MTIAVFLVLADEVLLLASATVFLRFSMAFRFLDLLGLIIVFRSSLSQQDEKWKDPQVAAPFKKFIFIVIAWNFVKIFSF